MIYDVARLVLGLAVVFFHRPIADFIMERERALDYLIRSRGVNLPQPPSESTAHNIYFFLGSFIVVMSLARLWFGLY